MGIIEPTSGIIKYFHLCQAPACNGRLINACWMNKWMVLIADMGASNSWVIIMIEGWSLHVHSCVILTRALQSGYYHRPILQVRKVKIWKGKGVAQGKQVKSGRDRRKMQIWLAAKAHFFRAAPSCLQWKKEQEISPKSFIRGMSLQGLRLCEPLPAQQGTCGPALRWNLDSDRGCACLDKAPSRVSVERPPGQYTDKLMELHMTCGVIKGGPGGCRGAEEGP